MTGRRVILASIGLLTCVTAGVLLRGGSAERQPGAKRPWGTLEITSIHLAPPAGVADALMDNAPSQPWAFENVTGHELARFVTDLALPREQRDRLLQSVSYDRAINGYRITPDAAVLTELSPTARGRLYLHLGASELNPAHSNAFRYTGATVQQWLADSGLRPGTKRLVRSLAYRNRSTWFFSDVAAALQRIADRRERRRLVRALAREQTLRLAVRLGPDADPAALARYWGAGGRRAEVERLFRNAKQRGKDRVELVELLPPFARDRLYRYPEPAINRGMTAERSRDCHWTALNFFNDEAEDRFAFGAAVAAAMKRAYRPVDGRPRFGDLVVFTEGDRHFHTAVYIADRIVFTRNGTRLSRPWMLMRMRHMVDFYPRRGPVEIHFLRPRANETHRRQHMTDASEEGSASTRAGI